MAKKSKESKIRKAKPAREPANMAEESGPSFGDAVFSFFGKMFSKRQDEAEADSGDLSPAWRSKRVIVAMAVIIIALAAGIYWQTRTFSLISLDDYDYVNQNTLIKDGLTWESKNIKGAGIKPAFTVIYQNFWIPVTWISYMVDIELTRLFVLPGMMDPGMMHRTNTLLYIANALVLFLFLRRATGSTWRSFFAALLWTAHPLRVESVAWVTERKDLLIGLFFLLSLWTHVLWVQTKKHWWYALVLVFMALGIMSKPTMMVLPAALLILDYWPLGRYTRQEGERIIDVIKKPLLEKIPHFILTIACMGMTYYTQITINPIAPRSSLSNISVAANGYWKYLERTFWPGDILFEPAAQRTDKDIIFSLFTITLLLAVSLAVWYFRKKAPELLYGWLWYIVVLSPNSGLISAGLQGYSDRFTYLPHIGITVILVWGSVRLFRHFGWDRRFLAAPALAIVLVLAAHSYHITSYWRDTIILFEHIDEIYEGKNAMAKNSLASEYVARNELWKALMYFEQVGQIEPFYPFLQYNKALVLHRFGKNDEALKTLDANACPSIQNNENEIVQRLRNQILRSMGRVK